MTTDRQRTNAKVYAEKRKKIDFRYESNRKALRRYRNNYGISGTDYIEMLIDQKGQCAICQERLLHRFVLDHDHVTGRLRKILCLACNTMLGQAKDRADILIRGAEYLEQHKPQ